MRAGRILQITDTHIVPEGTLAYGAVDTGAALTCVVETVNRLLPQIGPVDFAVVTGDLTDHGTAPEFARFRALMEDLAVPWLAVPGNHDRRAPMRAAFAGTDWMPPEGPIRWTAMAGGMAVIGIDTLVEGAPHGALDVESLDWLRQALARVAPAPVLLALHHPPIRTGITLMDRQNLRDAEMLHAVLGAYPGPLRLICGHVHRSFTGDFGGLPVVICPGTSHAVTVDLRDAPQNTLHVEPGGIMLHGFGQGIGTGFYTHIIPTGLFPGPFGFG